MTRCPTCQKNTLRVAEALTLIKKLMRLLDPEKRCARCVVGCSSHLYTPAR